MRPQRHGRAHPTHNCLQDHNHRGRHQVFRIPDIYCLCKNKKKSIIINGRMPLTSFWWWIMIQHALQEYASDAERTSAQSALDKATHLNDALD
jgi:hypothetical protein